MLQGLTRVAKRKTFVREHKLPCANLTELGGLRDEVNQRYGEEVAKSSGFDLCLEDDAVSPSIAELEVRLDGAAQSIEKRLPSDYYPADGGHACGLGFLCLLGFLGLTDTRLNFLKFVALPIRTGVGAD